MLAVRRVDDEDELSALSPDWSRLVEETPTATPFVTPEWLLPWWRHMGTGHRLSVLVAYESRRLAALLPLFVYEQNGQRHAASMGAGISDYLGLLAAPGVEDAAADAMLSWLAEHDAWDDLALDELRPGDALLERAAPPNLTDCICEQSVCTALDLPRDEPSLLAAIPGVLRHRIPEYRRRIARAGRASYDMATEATLDDDLEALFGLHSARWQSRGEAGVLADARLFGFHAMVAAGMLARGRLRLHVLRLDGVPIAVLHAFHLHDRTFSYLSGMAPSAAKFSPGILVIACAMSRAIADGARAFDMLRGDEPYKLRWRPRQWINKRRTFARR